MSGLVQLYKRDETFNTNEIANAVLGALVAVTGCCPFIDPPWAILIGCRWCCVYVYVRTHYSIILYVQMNQCVVHMQLIMYYFFTSVISVGMYHLGCLIEWAMGLHDGARVFPVHGVW